MKKYSPSSPLEEAGYGVDGDGRCHHPSVSYCVGQTDLKGEDVVFLEHRRPWPGKDVESFCGTGTSEENATFHEATCSDCGHNTTDYSIFCVFDGHNGRHAAKHSADFVLETVEKHLPRGNAPSMTHPDYEEWRILIQRALAITLVELNGTFAARGIHAGCTATIVLVTEWLVTCINLGDSHAYIDTGNQLFQLTCDHRVASNKADRRRVELTGSVVAPVSMSGSGPADAYTAGLGPLRVWPGGLCISRAIGDFDVGPSIVPFGYITQSLVPNKGARILIGSDGIWDAFSKKKKVGAMTRTWPLDAVPSKMISTIVKMYGTVKDDTSLIVVDILPIGSCFPEMAASTKQDLLASSIRSLTSSKASRPGKSMLCSCFGGGNTKDCNGSSVPEDSTRGSNAVEDSVRSGVSLKSQSSFGSQPSSGLVIEEVDVAEILDLMEPDYSSKEDSFVKPLWMVEELKEALLAASVFATNTWLEASGKLPAKILPNRPSKVSFADEISEEDHAPSSRVSNSHIRRNSSEAFRDSVLDSTASDAFGSRFGHYKTHDDVNGNHVATSRLLTAEMSVRAGRVYNSEASVRAGVQFKANVTDPFVRVRGSNLDGSVHMKAYDVDSAPPKVGKPFEQQRHQEGRVGEQVEGILKTRTVRRNRVKETEV
jgi:serine/threonine protein phosphatase PrpC